MLLLFLLLLLLLFLLLTDFFFNHIVGPSLAGILFIQDPGERWEYTNSFQYCRVTSSFEPCQTLSIWH